MKVFNFDEKQIIIQLNNFHKIKRYVYQLQHMHIMEKVNL